VAVAREVLKNLIDACEKLDLHATELPKWRDIFQRLPEYRINDEGALCEWLNPDFRDNYHHRHFSHLYPIFPGFEITEETAPDLLAAGRVALEKRLENGLPSFAGWSFPYLACCFARVGDGNRALQCIELLIRSCVGSNLFAYHNDWRRQGLGISFGLGWDCSFFSIDGNLGFTAAIQEMLLFSKPGFVSLLPALPERWEKGDVCGLRCRGGITVDISWERSSIKTTLLADHNQTVTLKCSRKIASIQVSRGDLAIEKSPLGSAYRELRLEEEKTAVLSIVLVA
jgi:alpha-L-fucosidase 2